MFVEAAAAYAIRAEGSRGRSITCLVIVSAAAGHVCINQKLYSDGREGQRNTLQRPEIHSRHVAATSTSYLNNLLQ